MLTCRQYEVRITKSSLSEQCISILERRCPPSRFLEVICQQTLGCRLFTVPVCDTPETLKDVLLSEGEVIQSTVDGIFLFRLGVFTSGEDFELCFLINRLVRGQGNDMTDTYHSYGIRKPHEETAFTSSLPGQFPIELPGDKICENILAAAMVSPNNLPP